MLAKELKIQNIKRQREYLKKTFKKLKHNPDDDGDCTILYLGTLYPETISYLVTEGFCVKTLKSESTLALTNGYPLNIITISDDIKLSESERTKAESIDVKVHISDIDDFDGFDDFIDDVTDTEIGISQLSGK